MYYNISILIIYLYICICLFITGYFINLLVPLSVGFSYVKVIQRTFNFINFVELK